MIGIIITLLYLVFFLPLIIRAVQLKERNPSFSKIKFQFFFAVFGFIFVTVFLSLIDFQVNVLWFRSVGYIAPFLKRIGYKLLLFFVGFVFSYLIYSLAFYVPKRHEELEISEKVINTLKIVVPIVLAFFTGLMLSSNFETFILFLNRTPSETLDPIFNKPVSFYLFTYPFVSTILSFILGIFIVAFIVEEIIYLTFIKPNFHPNSQASIHATNLLSTIAGFAFLFVGLRVYFSMYSLLFERSGAVFGVGFTDYYVRIPIYKILAVAFIVISIFLFIYALLPRFTQRTPIIRVIVIGILVLIVAYQLIPALFQVLIVKPTELSKEKTFLSYNIAFTRNGYNLSNFNSIEMKDIKPLTKDALLKESGIVDNLRLWDWRALKDTLQQIQSIRLYYTFNDVDVDRYIINGKLKEVLVSARELDSSLLPESSKTWVNIHLKYTHGYGLCMNTVNEFTEEGLPNLLIKDIPPVSSIKGLKVTRPEIYFGELTNDYVFVKTKTEEFDYPKGEDNAYATYLEDRGIPMTPLNRLILAIHLNDQNIILSQYITSESRILLTRNILERVNKICPYLKFSNDPYIVLGDDGKLYWMGDAFTTSQFYPYSEPTYYFDSSFNYIRNSVKYIVDAYTGDVFFYVVDKTDPIAQTLMKAFPEMFKDFSEMKDFFKNHMRYPDDMVVVQGDVFLNYHMSDPEVFYNKEDRWTVATEKYYSNTQSVIPYYAIVKDNQTNSYTFANLYPFTPFRKNNLVALMIAYSDKDNYGKVDVIRYPKDKLVYGPLQIEARVDQDSEISKVLTLWNQQGSEVIRGNLLVIPIDSSIFYVEPVYLQASSAKFPQIKKVVLATQDKLVWGDTFDEAVKLLFGEGVSTKTSETNLSIQELLNLAQTHFENYKKYVASGEYDKAGLELKAVEEIINEISKIEGKAP